MITDDEWDFITDLTEVLSITGQKIKNQAPIRH